MRFTVTTTDNNGQTVSSEIDASQLADFVWGLTRYVVEGTFSSLEITRTEETN